jgi:hypothetical protein
MTDSGRDNTDAGESEPVYEDLEADLKRSKLEDEGVAMDGFEGEGVAATEGVVSDPKGVMGLVMLDTA